MRKRLFIFVLLFVFLFSFSQVKIHANEIDVVGVDRISSADILYGMSELELNDSNFKKDIKELEKLNIIDSGYISSTLEFRAYKFGNDLKTKLSFNNGKIINYSASYGNITFYEVDIINEDLTLKENIPMAIKDIYGDTVSCQDIIGNTKYDMLNYKNGKEQSDFKGHYDLINRLLFNYIHYQMEEEKSLNINVAMNNAPSIGLILNNMFDNYYLEKNNYIPYNSFIDSDTYKATIYVYEKDKYIKYNTNINVLNKELSTPVIKVKKDEELSNDKIKEIIEESSDLTLLSFDAINDNYTDSKTIVGEYTNTYLIKDKNNIYYLIDININVTNVTPINVDDDITTIVSTTSMINTTSSNTKTNPTSSNESTKTSSSIPTTSEVINENDNIYVFELLTNEFKLSYKDKISIDDLLDELVFDSTYDIKDITYNTDYKDNNNVGNYIINVEVKDDKNHVITKDIDLIIYDDIKPVLVLPEIITNTSNFISLSEIQNRILAVDEVDGEISSKNINLTDSDNYLTKYKESGSYEIVAKVSDKSGNEVKASLEIIVKDIKEYNNYEENNIINLTNSSKITKRDFLSYLVKNNYITTSNLTLESPYFDIDNPDGEYELIVKSKTDEKIFTINVYDGKIYKKNIIDTKDNKDYKIYYIVIGASTIFVLIITILSIIMYRKKRNKE